MVEKPQKAETQCPFKKIKDYQRNKNFEKSESINSRPKANELIKDFVP